MSAEPIVATMIGDPCGIGPEVVIKALASGTIPGRTLLIGDAWIIEQTIASNRAPLKLHAIESVEQARFAPGCVDVLDPGTLKPEEVTVGQVSAACGRAMVRWWDIAISLAQANKVAALTKAPVNSEAMRLGSGVERAGLQPGKDFLFLVTGPLRVVHLTDHITLREMLEWIKLDNVLSLIRLMHRSLRQWGISAPRIGVAGLNPHCYGPEEEREIAPAVQKARSEGIDAIGPVAPDTIFRQGTKGMYDCILAHYHDQGHIPVKTWRFTGNCALTLGQPYINISVAHGTAFDIAGKGIADHRSMMSAMKTAAMLAAGQGFPKD